MKIQKYLLNRDRNSGTSIEYVITNKSSEGVTKGKSTKEYQAFVKGGKLEITVILL